MTQPVLVLHGEGREAIPEHEWRGYATFRRDVASGTWRPFGDISAFANTCHGCHTIVRARDFVYTQLCTKVTCRIGWAGGAAECVRPPPGHQKQAGVCKNCFHQPTILLAPQIPFRCVEYPMDRTLHRQVANPPKSCADAGKRKKMARQARDIMTPDPARCTANTPVDEVAKLMVHNNCGEIPVVDAADRVIGVVTDRDIVCRVVATGKNPIGHTAAECMSTAVVTVAPTTPLETSLPRWRSIRSGECLSSMTAVVAPASSLRQTWRERSRSRTWVSLCEKCRRTQAPRPDDALFTPRCFAL